MLAGILYINSKFSRSLLFLFLFFFFSTMYVEREHQFHLRLSSNWKPFTCSSIPSTRLPRLHLLSRITSSHSSTTTTTTRHHHTNPVTSGKWGGVIFERRTSSSRSVLRFSSSTCTSRITTTTNNSHFASSNSPRSTYSQHHATYFIATPDIPIMTDSTTQTNPPMAAESDWPASPLIGTHR